MLFGILDRVGSMTRKVFGTLGVASVSGPRVSCTMVVYRKRLLPDLYGAINIYPFVKG